ncbi:Mitochondrial editing factor 21 [Hibiscus syriacus]|uniref:Mitochondrial editing factor 21 n=1 Tax=Hibiscus syriacus TaxID=106335 RepID=A0A6A3AQS0_HIBSY|nr:Mitochondrial editing factor 21 [Hibiscus syriacus]
MVFQIHSLLSELSKSYHSILKAKQLHALISKTHLSLDPFFATKLLRFYAFNGDLCSARNLFDKAPQRSFFLWNSIIRAYAQAHHFNVALSLFNKMLASKTKLDNFTFASVIRASYDNFDLDGMRLVHAMVILSGLGLDSICGSALVLGSLVSFYSRFKCMDSANTVFCSLLQLDLVAWSSLITGHSQCGDYGKALLYFRKLNMEKGKTIDPILVSVVLASIAQSSNVRFGIEIHGYVVRHGFELNVLVSSALIDMYCLGLNGLPSQAFKALDEMLRINLKPDDSTFSALLSSCCHAGLFDDGFKVFRGMISEFCIQPKIEHYVHVVKLLGMVGQIEEAYNLILCLPKPIDSGILGALLSCREVHGNFDFAEAISLQLLENESQRSADKVMLSNIYAVHGKWDAVQKLRYITERKLSGLSWIESGKT